MKKAVSLIGVGIAMFLFVGLTSTSVNAQKGDRKPWVVPDKSKSVANPVKSNAETQEAGKALYTKSCKSCHGVKGLGDGPKSKELDTPCGDFTKKEFTAQTDGEIFYKVKEGRDDMPSFKKKITDDNEIWQIVTYVRTLGGK